MKYPGVKIFLSKDIPEEQVYALNNSYWCGVNQKRWVYAADVLAFSQYLTRKILFNPPFRLIQSKATCLGCRQRSKILVVKASGYVPVSSASSEVAASLGRLLNTDLDLLSSQAVYMTYVQEYPADFLKMIRRHSFLFRKYAFDEGHNYFANACIHCKTAIDDFQIFYEQDGALARCNPYPDIIQVTDLDYHLPLVIDCQFA